MNATSPLCRCVRIIYAVILVLPGKNDEGSGECFASVFESKRSKTSSHSSKSCRSALLAHVLLLSFTKRRHCTMLVGTPPTMKALEHHNDPNNCIMKQEVSKMGYMRHRMRARRTKQRFRTFSMPVTILMLLSCWASHVGCQKTANARLYERTLVNLHESDLDANKDLDLTTDPADVARQVLDRIGFSVRDLHNKGSYCTAGHLPSNSHFICSAS